MAARLPQNHTPSIRVDVENEGERDGLIPMDEDGDLSVILGMLCVGMALAAIALLGFTPEGLLVVLLALTGLLMGPGVEAVRWLELRRRSARQTTAAKEVEVGVRPAAARAQFRPGVGAVREPGNPKRGEDSPELETR